MGGVLYQEINGERKNIHFHSQMLLKLQRKWSTIEKEALTIYYCVTRMKLFLLGHEFIIQTDHCPLRGIHKKSSLNRRVDRISLILQQYNIKEISHISGKYNCLADYLSRYLCRVEDHDIVDSDFDFITSHKSTENNNVISTVTTRAQARAKYHQPIPTSSDTSSNRASSPYESSLKGVNHDFDIRKTADSQKEDAFYQAKLSEIKKNSSHCSYVLDNKVLYKMITHRSVKHKLLYITSSMVQQLLQAYHNIVLLGQDTSVIIIRI